MACYDVVDDLQHKLRIFKLSTRTLTHTFILYHYTGPEYRVLFLGNRNISGGKKKHHRIYGEIRQLPPSL